MIMFLYLWVALGLFGAIALVYIIVQAIGVPMAMLNGYGIIVSILAFAWMPFLTFPLILSWMSDPTRINEAIWSSMMRRRNNNSAAPYLSACISLCLLGILIRSLLA